jgi:tape measure domain-containing protein
MTQSAGIQLQVGLDLAFFRQQLTTLGTTAAGYKLPINVQFDRRSIQNELNALGRNISQRTYRLEVATNLSTEIKNAGTLAKALRGLDNAIQKNKGIANRAAGGTTAGATVDAGKIQALVNRATKPALQALYSEMSRAKIPMMDVGKGAVEDLRKSIVSGVPGITQDLARGLANGLNPELKENGTKGAKIFIDAFKTAAGIASPSKVFKALGEFSADGLEIGFLNGLKDFKTKAVAEIKSIVKSLQQEARVGMIATGGLLSPVAGPRTAATRTIPGVPLPRNAVSNQDPGRSNNRILNSLSLLTGDPKLYRSRMANLGASRLPSSLLGSAATQMNLESMAPSFKQSRLGGTKTGVANIIDEAFFGRGTLPKASSALNGLSNTIERLASAARAAAPSGILQSASGNPRFRAFGGVPSSQSMGIFPPTAQPTAYPPSGGFLQFSRRATAISAGLPGNVFGGRQPPGGPLGAPTGGSLGGPPGAPPRPPSGGGGMGGMANFGRALAGINLPGAGAVREIGEEFGMAAKQVLLFGTAYKALAFATSFPAQVGQAVSALQSFNNTLKAISPSAEEARASNQFILDIVDRYNVPLQSARDGFTKLYASMAPAGFKGDEIRDLFTGVSQAAATFGMSADKVDRVNYAFAQMASKGQVMSEELKGQLGDVLPGAMGIFAEAAGFKGPDAIQKFSKALEDGAYKGEAMRGLLKNVTVVLTKEFGPGAEGAARTFQGVINRMQNSTKLLYEAFEPVAVGFLNSVVVPLTSGIKTVADGFNAFFTGVNAKTSGGFAIAQELEKLRPTFNGLRENAGQLIQVFGQFAQIALGVGKVLLQIASNPFVGFMAKIYAIIVPLNMALGVMRGLWALNSLQLLIFNARIAVGTTTLTAFRGMMAATGATATTTAAAIRAGFASTGVGLVLVGIGLLIERFLSMNQALADTKTKALGAADAIRSMSQTEARQAENQATRDVKILQSLREKKNEGKAIVAITKEEQSALERAGVRTGKMVVPGQMAMKGSLPELLNYGQQAVDVTQIQGALLAREGVAATAKRQIEDLRFQSKQETATTTLSPVAGTEAIGTGAADKAAQDAARLASQQQQNAIDAANLQNALDKARYDGLTILGDQAFQHAISLIDARNSYELAGLDSIASRQEKFQQDLQKIELDRIDTVRQATQKAVEASLKFAAAQNTAVAAGAGRTQGGGTGLFQGSTGISSGPHFDVRRADGGIISETEARALFSEDVRRQLTMTSGYGPRRAPAPGASTFHRGIDLAGPANTPLNLASGYSLMGVGQEGGLGYAASVQGPQGQSYKVGHLQKPGAGYTMQRREAKAGGNLQVEQLERSNALEEASLVAINATTEALAKREALIASNINTIFPVAEQRLQNDLTKIRNDLQLKGMPQEYIDYQEESYKASYEMSEAIKKNKEDTDKYQQTVDALQGKKAKGIALTKDETNALTFYTGAIAQNKASLETLTRQQAEYNIAALEGAIAAMKNSDALKAQQETMDLIKSSVESATSSYKGFMKEVITGGDPTEALKKFQEAIADQVVTIFLDFAMKPVEDMLKNQLSALFGIKTEEQAREEAVKKMEEQLNELKASREIQSRIDQNVQAIASGGGGQSQSADIASTVKSIGLSSGIDTSLNGLGGAATAGFDAGSVFGNPEALTGAFANIQSSISTSMEGISSSFQMGADSLASTLPSWSDSLTTAIPAALTTSTAKTNSEVPNFQESLGKVAAGIGIAAGSIMGIAAGISQIKEGGTSNVLGGIGSILTSVGGGMMGFMNLFGAANGAVWNGGFQAFANGGTVTGPTLGLIGEGKYNEAIVPLPDGRSIPVQMRGGSSRDLLNAPGSAPAAPTMLSMSFQSTTINGVEYVDRAQLEAAMAETRKSAARDGASRGASLALDKLQNSPSARRRIGIR